MEGFARVLAVEPAQDRGAARMFPRVTRHVDVDAVDLDDNVLDVGLERFHSGGVALLSQRLDGALLHCVDGALLRIDAIRRIHSIGVCVAKRCDSAQRGSRTRRRRMERDRRPQ